MDDDVAIGIDLGTTYCCMAIYKNGKVVIISNEMGAAITPSYIALDQNNNVCVGSVAKKMAFLYPTSTAFDVKRLIGLPFDNPDVQKDIQNWPFQVTGEGNIPKIIFHGRPYHPEEVSGMLLASLKAQAEEFLRCKVTKAVITVPAYFNDGQRQATKHAGTIANLDVITIINEPTAAAIAYCHQNIIQGKQTNFIFDLGGGTLDVAVLTVEKNNIKMKAIGGDTHLGGDDFDNAMVQYCIEEFKRQSGIDLNEELHSPNEMNKMKGQRCLQRLKIECEQQKINLSAAHEIILAMDAFYNGIDAVVRITRDLFNARNNHLFQKCMQIVQQVLEDAKIDKSEIDEVILVGGSSKIPKIREMIRGYFKGKKLSVAMNGDEAVAYGAAIQAAFITCKDEIEARHGQITTTDVVSLPIGLQLKKKGSSELAFRIVIDKNTALPCSNEWLCRTYKEGQRGLVVIRQGEHDEVTKNYLLGKFKAENLPSHCPIGTSVKIKMLVDREGILTVTASYEGTDQTNSLTVKARNSRLTQEELVSLIIKELSLNTKT
ncbi:unnamed protein product [Allacma fusca]|uniref:Uncharacterized protein n=1 Tax=Allacma fusca TaxID=39272 RepID=A0A8J2JYP9_9HEXA|nr:unnamed protein product [Allacma fusca]